MEGIGMGNHRKAIKGFSALYIKEQMKIALIITLPICVLLFATALFTGSPKKDMLMILIPLFSDVVFLCFLYWKTRRFDCMIQNQENHIGACFGEEEFTPLYPKTLFFCSAAWFVKSGCWAFHKDCLKEITVGVTGEKTPARHYVVVFHTIDGKVFTDCNMRSGEIQKLKQWYNQ